MIVSMGSTARNQCGMSWPMLESVLRVVLAAVGRQILGYLFSRRTSLLSALTRDSFTKEEISCL